MKICNLNKFYRLTITTRSLLIRTMSSSSTDDVQPTQAKKRRSSSSNSMDEIFSHNIRSTSNVVALYVLSNGYAHTTKSCLLATPSRNYLFECGEGTARILNNGFFNTHQTSLGRLEHVFVTSALWSSTGGIITLLEALFGHRKIMRNYHPNDDNVKLLRPIKFHAPFRLVDLVRSTLGKNKMSAITFHDYAKQGDFEDSEVRVQAIPLVNDNSKKTLFAYLIEPRASAPAVDAARLDKILQGTGIKKGPWIRDLVTGTKDTIELAENLTIRAADILDYTPCQTRSMLIVNCPDVSYLPCLRADHLINRSKMHLIVHTAPSHVLHSSAYMDWIGSYPDKKCVHVFLDETKANVSMVRPYEIQEHLSLIDECIYPRLPTLLPVDSESEEIKDKKKQMRIIDGKTAMIFQVQPMPRLATNDVLRTFESAINSKANETVAKQVAELKSHLKAPTQFSYPGVLFLGTCSAGYTSARSNTSIMLQTNASSNLLIDCGEDTIGQLRRFFGSEEQLDAELLKLRAIFISHNHTDHFSGLPGVLLRRRQAFERNQTTYQPCYGLLPPSLDDNIRVLSAFVENLDEYMNLVPLELLVHNAQPHPHKYYRCMQTIGSECTENKLSTMKQKVLFDLRLSDIEAVPVDHIPNTFGLCVQFRGEKTYKMVYSSDCRPTKALVERGKDCDLLIHEATYVQAEEDFACRNKHSTVQEAVRVGKEMNAGFTILTHFSQRYHRVTKLDEIDDAEGRVGVAFDNMRVSLNNVHVLAEHVKLLEVLFREELEEINENATKKMFRKERLARIATAN